MDNTHVDGGTQCGSQFRRIASLRVNIAYTRAQFTVSTLSINKRHENLVRGSYSISDRVTLVGQNNDPQPLVRNECHICSEAIG